MTITRNTVWQSSYGVQCTIAQLKEGHLCNILYMVRRVKNFQNRDELLPVLEEECRLRGLDPTVVGTAQVPHRCPKGMLMVWDFMSFGNVAYEWGDMVAKKDKFWYLFTMGGVEVELYAPINMSTVESADRIVRSDGLVIKDRTGTSGIMTRKPKMSDPVKTKSFHPSSMMFVCFQCAKSFITIQSAKKHSKGAGHMVTLQQRQAI